MTTAEEAQEWLGRELARDCRAGQWMSVRANRDVATGVQRGRVGAVLILDIAVAQAAKYAVRESGDSVEVVERPCGGLSVVMVDGQRSGRSAKAISNVAVRKAISLLAEGVRDGAVACGARLPPHGAQRAGIRGTDDDLAGPGDAHRRRDPEQPVSGADRGAHDRAGRAGVYVARPGCASGGRRRAQPFAGR